jgi:hypothetical protein
MNDAGQPLQLHALSIGSGIPSGSFSAVVHSAFHSALNIRLQSGDSLLTVVSADEADLPQGIRVKIPVGFTFEQFKVGELVSCDAEYLRLDSLTIDLRGASRWKCDLPSLNADLSNPSVLQAWKIVWRALNERQQTAHADIVAEDLIHPTDDASNPISQRAGDAMRKLLDAARRHDSTDMESPLRSLIGLGSGLTPGGDDLLVGFLAGLWCSVQESPERTRFVNALAQELSRLSSRTNDISRTYLFHAARGQVSSRLANLANSICAADPAGRLLAVFDPAVQTGHSSGMDAVTGLLFGLDAWSAKPVVRRV